MTEHPWINVETLSTLQAVMEDEFQAVVAAFYQQVERAWPQIQTHLGDGDLSAVCRAAHGLKGSALSLGADALSEALAQLEAAARQGAPEDSSRLAAQCQQTLEATLNALKEQLA